MVSILDFHDLVNQYSPDLHHFEAIYRDLHQHPELSRYEERTASIIGSQLEKLGFEVHTSIGGHGVVGVLRNGPGKTVMMRSELDGLPGLEKTGLDYASVDTMINDFGIETPVVHACGHDVNMASLLAASSLLVNSRSQWKGTLIALFQPDEETTHGAQAMLDDGLYSMIPVPDIILGQHVVPQKAGNLLLIQGPSLMTSTQVDVRIFGGPGPDTNPQHGPEPILVAAHALVRIQSIITQDISPRDSVKIVCRGFHAGEPGADYVEYADFELDVKTFDLEVRAQALAAVKRVVLAECKASGLALDPQVNITTRAPLTYNDPTSISTIDSTFKEFFGVDKVLDSKPDTASEDIGVFALPHNTPLAYWTFGGIDAKVWDDAEKDGKLAERIPTNHSPFFAPAIEPTLKTGMDAMSLAALTFLNHG